jgi:hypothetical protein
MWITKTTAKWIVRGAWIAVIAATILYGCEQPSKKLLANGSPAPDFTFNDAYGKPVRLSDYKGYVVVLCFYNTSYSDSLPVMSAAADSFKVQKVAFIGVNMWNEYDEFRDYVIHHPHLCKSVRLVYAPEPQGANFPERRYGVTGVPTLMAIDQKGVVVQSGYCWDQTYITELVNWALAHR